MDELKTCPFCGSEAEFNSDEFGEGVDCKSCGATLRNGVYGEYGRKLASAAWNTRPLEDAIKKELDEAREDNCENMEYHVAERERLKKEIEELRGCVSFAERMRILELLKSCCDEFVKSQFKPCRRVKTVDAKGRCTGRATCPIYAELTKGAKNEM